MDNKLTLEEIEERLKAIDGIPGTFNRLGERGARFVPESWEVPTLYFGLDGKSLEVMTRDQDIGEIDRFLRQLAQVLGSGISSENLGYG